MGACPIHSFADPLTNFRPSFELPLVNPFYCPHSTFMLIYMQGIAVVPFSTQGFSLTAVYAPECLSENDADIILDHLGGALVFLAAHPHDAIGDFDLLSRNKRQV
jgi:hypothetical protein